MAAPTGYVLKVYLTEAAARTGGTAGALAVDADGKINTAGQAAGYHFWTHTKYWYRIEANEPVSEFYIDWDDGESNDPKGEANYTIIKLDTPSFVGITGHIYTGNSTTSGGYFPKLRVKSVDGYWSKFYQNKTAGINFRGIEILQGDTSLPDGRNNKYLIENDYGSSDEEYIPALYPQIKPPVAVLKTDKKRVYAGIFNDYILGSDGSVATVTDGATIHLVEGFGRHASEGTVRTDVNVRVTYTTTGNDGYEASGRGDISVTDLSLGGTASISNVTKILKVELLNLLEDAVDYTNDNAVANKLYPGEKMILIINAYDDTTEQTIAEVSLGNPIVEADNPRYTVTYDLTESFARTSEQSISNYYLDDGSRKVNNGFTESTRFQNSVNDAEATAHSDVLNNNNNRHEISSGIKRQSYTFDLGYNVVDSDFRWLPKQILARGQIKASNPLGTTNKRNMQYSFLEHWVNEGHTKNYSDTMEDIIAYNWTSDISSSAVMAFKGMEDADRWVDLEPYNKKAGGPSNYLIRSVPDTTGSRLFGNDNVSSLGDNDNTAILLCARDSKWTKQFWNTTFNNSSQPRGKADYAIPGSSLLGMQGGSSGNEGYLGRGVGSSGVGHMNVRVEAYYSGYESSNSSNLAWKPLKYLNKTKHPDYDDSTWYTDGVFDWEEPDDWVSCDPDDILDSYYPRGDYFTDPAGAYGDADESTWAFSTHDQAGSVIPDISAAQETTNITVASGNLKGKLTGGWIILNRANTTPPTWDVFWWDGTGSQSQPAAADVASLHVIDEAAILSFNEVDISDSGETTDPDFAEDLAAEIHSHAHYSAQQGIGGSAAIVTVTHAAAGAAVDAPALGGQYPNSGGDCMHTISVTTQGVSATTGGDYFESAAIWNDVNKKYALMFLIKTDAGRGNDGTHEVKKLQIYTQNSSTYAYSDGLSSNDKARIRRTWWCLKRHGPDDKYDLFWFDTTSGTSDTPTNSEIIAGTSNISSAAQINSVNRVDISAASIDTDAEYATAMKDVIDAHSSGLYNATVSGDVITVTWAESGRVDNISKGKAATDSGSTNWILLGSNEGQPASPGTALEGQIQGSDPTTASETYAYTDILNTWPCSNNHSSIIDLIDPMCVSLNNYAITQSIAYTHKGKYQTVEDRLGRADVRKIGSAGGSIKFGGIDATDGARAKFNEFQSKATPLYLDVSHTNGDISRFFGVITSMSEDHPTGKMTPKFGLMMTISHMITMNSSGTMLSDGYISLGGEISEPKYI